MSIQHSSAALLRANPRLRYAAFLPLALLAACSAPPQMQVTRAFGRGVVIENTDTKPFMVQRVVANDSPENSNCNNYPNASLSPGQSHTIVFLLCGSVRSVEVQTDEGTAAFTISTEGE